MVRHLVVEHCLASSATPDGPFVPALSLFDAAYAQPGDRPRLYLQQHHPDRDLDAIGRHRLSGGR